MQVEKLVVNGVKMIANMRGAWRLYDGEPDDVLTKSSMWGVIDNFRIFFREYLYSLSVDCS